jgi:hypothetical protein
MAKQITFEFEGKNYTLEFTRKSIETMERQGFVIGDIVDKPMLTLPALFAGGSSPDPLGFTFKVRKTKGLYGHYLRRK